MIAALLDPGAYSEKPPSVELKQTHISYVLLTPEYAYKIKKPVDFGFLDFTTLEKRRFFCEEEVRLNRRLSTGVYLGVVAVTGEGGRITMEGNGVSVEWAVKMKRIADDTILEEAIKRGKADADTLRRIGRVITAFHAKAETNAHISEFGGIEAIRKNTGENFVQTASYIGKTISKKQYEAIKKYSGEFIETNAALLAKRVKDGFIKDCHGDLHAEHVSISDGIEIIDCIEFNERFRFSDTAADIAFLSMDIECHGRGDLSRAFEAEYFKSAGDADGIRLLNFYKCYRAYVRGKVAGFKSSEEDVPEEERMAARLDAMLHFRLAGLYATGGFCPALIIIRGLSGTGKSMLAGAIKETLGGVSLSSDAIRKELGGVKPSEHIGAAYGEGIYSPEFTEKTYAELIKRSAELLSSGRNVVADATFSKARHLKKMLAAAKEACAHAFIIECRAKDETIRERLAKRASAGDERGESDADWEIYKRQKDKFEEVDVERLAVEAERQLSESVVSAIEFICGFKDLD